MKKVHSYQFRFPDDFLFGTAHSAYQSEGACDRDGKSESMMEYYAREKAGAWLPGLLHPEKGHYMSVDLPTDGCHFFDHYEEYIDDMRKTGQDAFRMSLSWCRILPNGIGRVNQKGIDYYNRVIDKLLENGITPFVDLLHWDLPQCLHEQGGYENPAFPEWFERYAEVCFAAFGDRVKLWSTVNEPCVAITSAYMMGRFPPYVKDLKRGMQAAQNTILAHFRAVRLYKRMNLGGKIGAVHAILPVYPSDICQQDLDAARRQAELRLDIWLQPMLQGIYPPQLLAELPAYRQAMPEDYQQQLDQWFAPMDFVGINYYCPARTRYEPNNDTLSQNVETFYAQPGKMLTYPAGLFDSMIYLREKYDNIEVYITENGLFLPNTGNEEEEVNDTERIHYMREHLRMVVRSIQAGVNLKGYFYWNDADCYEQMEGYSQRFGLTWVDHATGRRRWKKSREYYKKVIENRTVD